MTKPQEAPVTQLSEADSWARLSGVTLGRLATSAAGQPDIFPVNFVVQRRTITCAVKDNGQSGVVVKGYAHVLSRLDDLEEAERAQVHPWTATPKLRFIRIVPTQITGRHFQFGAEPDYILDFG